MDALDHTLGQLGAEDVERVVVDEKQVASLGDGQLVARPKLVDPVAKNRAAGQCGVDHQRAIEVAGEKAGVVDLAPWDRLTEVAQDVVGEKRDEVVFFSACFELPQLHRVEWEDRKRVVGDEGVGEGDDVGRVGDAAAEAREDGHWKAEEAGGRDVARAFDPAMEVGAGEGAVLGGSGRGSGQEGE